ncbi:EF-hand domain-containing protein [Rhizorhabdus argentea]|uniref:EF-hand domain-containing protein n=1 Tax=Rhizorhabdus argentea TaxID=1387174 RepID=UPI0030EEBC97
MKRAFLLLAVMAAPAVARPAAPPAICSEPIKPQLFISPMGEPFRPKGDDDNPPRRWFDQADRDHDGKLTIGEMMLDGDRFFATLDKDHNGELLPDEVYAYEQDVAPEIRLYQRRPGGERGAPRAERDDERQRSQRYKGGPPGFDGATGAGRYGFLNIPNPVASADDDINRAVSAKEFRAAAAERFRDLDPNQSKALTLAQLPSTPAQIAANAACLARVKEAKARR